MIKDERSDGPIGGWIKHPKVPIRRMPPDVPGYWVDVGNAVRELEDRCIALEVNATAASWYWRENVGERAADELVADIAERLNTIALLQKRADEATREAQSGQE